MSTDLTKDATKFGKIICISSKIQVMLSLCIHYMKELWLPYAIRRVYGKIIFWFCRVKETTTELCTCYDLMQHFSRVYHEKSLIIGFKFKKDKVLKERDNSTLSWKNNKVNNFSKTEHL